MNANQNLQCFLAVKVQNPSGQIDIVLQKSTAGQWKSIGKTLEKNNDYTKTIETGNNLRNVSILLSIKVQFLWPIVGVQIGLFLRRDQTSAMFLRSQISVSQVNKLGLFLFNRNRLQEM